MASAADTPTTDPAIVAAGRDAPVAADAPCPAPVVSVLIISYNTRPMTLACLQSLREQTALPHQVIVVDNASRDGSAAAMAAAFPEVELVARPDNLGFAGGNNLAAARARGEYLLLLNPDTVVLEHAVDRLVAFARARPAGRHLGRAHALRRSAPQSRLVLAAHDALEHRLPRRRA